MRCDAMRYAMRCDVMQTRDAMYAGGGGGGGGVEKRGEEDDEEDNDDDY